MVDEELEGDWVDERDFDPEPLLFEDDEEANAPAPPVQYGQPERRQPQLRRLGGARTSGRSARRAFPPPR